MREPADRAKIERFLRELGKRVRRPARVVLTGGASMILRRLREETVDIDLSYTVAPEDDTRFASAIRDLKDDLSINVELSEPGLFMPMPGGREGRLAYFGRYEDVDVLLDDPNAIALSKLQRAHRRDVNDVRLLAEAKLVDLAELEAKAREVAAAPTKAGLRVNLDRMLATLDEVRAWLQRSADVPPKSE